MAQPQTNQYSDDFFSYINEGSTRSAKVIVPLLRAALPIRTVLDVGCGQGAWLRVWKEQGADAVLGLDGSYVDRQKLLVGQEEFVEQDLNKPFNLGKTFDLAQSLEVAEHLSPESSAAFVASLTQHADRVLFSAAPPGQGGKGHINERPYRFWAQLFLDNGFVPVDFLRPQILNNKQVEFWYRYNTLLFVRKSAVSSLPAALAACVVDSPERVKDYSPLPLWLRKQILSRLPSSAVSQLALVKHKVFNLVKSGK